MGGRRIYPCPVCARPLADDEDVPKMVPCDDAAVERVAKVLAQAYGGQVADGFDRQLAEAVLRAAAGETPGENRTSRLSSSTSTPTSGASNSRWRASGSVSDDLV